MALSYFAGDVNKSMRDFAPARGAYWYSCWLCVQMSGRDAQWARVSRWARCSPWHPSWPTTKINGGSPSTANSNTRTPIWRPAPCKNAMPEPESLRHATRLARCAALRFSHAFSVRKQNSKNHYSNCKCSRYFAQSLMNTIFESY